MLPSHNRHFKQVVKMDRHLEMVSSFRSAAGRKTPSSRPASNTCSLSPTPIIMISIELDYYRNSYGRSDFKNPHSVCPEISMTFTKKINKYSNRRRDSHKRSTPIKSMTNAHTHLSMTNRRDNASMGICPTSPKQKEITEDTDPSIRKLTPCR